MNGEVAEWTDFFSKVFSEAQRLILKQYRLEEDGSGPPEILAVRDMVVDFRCPVRIVEIRIDIEKHKHIKDELCQIMRYDFSRLGVGAVEYYGIVDERNSIELRELLLKNFDLGDISFREFKDFTTIGWSDDEMNFYTQFPLYNIRNNFREFVLDFWTHVFDHLTDKMRQKFRKGVDWNSRFNLKPDPILPISEITKMDRTLSGFLPFSKGAGIEELQKDIRNIQLIPGVPEDVKRVFRHAKDLHVYGFFRYNFFTIAQHYAYLALESAIKNRYYQSFGREIVLTNKKGETAKLGRIDHQIVWDFCHRKKEEGKKDWDVHTLKINGEKIAFTTKELLTWLVKKGIITMWERKQCENGMTLRHLMSHLTHPSILPPGYSIRALESVADIINRLFSNSPRPSEQ